MGMNDKTEDASVNHEGSVPLFPRGLIYFHRWKTLRWFLILVIPVIVCAADVYLHRHILWESALVLLFGVAAASALFVELVSGIASSKQSDMHGIFLEGTFSRSRNPILYWIQIGFTASLYLFVIVMGFAVARQKPIPNSASLISIHRPETSTPKKFSEPVHEKVA